MADNKKIYPHYFKQLPQGTTHVDVYLLLGMFNVRPDLADAVKKLLCSGVRGVKDQLRDITEARDSINRVLEIMQAWEASPQQQPDLRTLVD